MKTKLAISNIAWGPENDALMFKTLASHGYSGLEIAPTRLFPDKPYSHSAEAMVWAQKMRSDYGLAIVSMQSIWFGRTENIFGSPDEQEKLIEYTQKAIDFAQALSCGNLVFGCPKNRLKPADKSETQVVDFFKRIGEYAANHDCVIALEANPAIYGTNFLNYTQDAIDFARLVDSPGVHVNVDLGTIIQNDEPLEIVADNMGQVNHLHLSEPYLEVLKKRSLHRDLAEILRTTKYDKFVSIEMKMNDDLELVLNCLDYVAEVFG